MSEIDKSIEDYSQAVFGKPADELKWLMVTHHIHERLIKDEECLRTGLYSWIPVFDGDIKLFSRLSKEDIEQYDIVHVNLSGQDIHIVGKLREMLGENSNTKIVANNDYTCELWQYSFDFLSTLRREINDADMIFGTEPNQVGSLSVLLNRNVPLIVHPCFTKRIKSLNMKKSRNLISVVSHRYDNNNIVPSIAVDGLGYETRLIGYDPESDKKRYVTVTCYNSVYQGTNYMDFMEQLMESNVVYDPFTFTSQNRTGWDCAALGVPMVGSDRTYSVQKCFPKTAVPPFDAKKGRDMIRKILEDKEFRKEVTDYAQQAVEDISYENSKHKYLKALYDSQQ